MTAEQLEKLGVKDESELLTKWEELQSRANKASELEPQIAEFQNKFTATSNELNTLRGEYENYKTSVKPVANEFVSYIDELAKKGLDEDQITQVLPLRKLKPEELAPDRAVKLAYKFQNPGLNDNHAEVYFKKEFGLNIEDPNLTDDDKTAMEAKLINKSNEAKTYLKEYLGKQFTPKVDVEAQQREQRIKEATDYWTAKIPDIVKHARTIAGEYELELPGGKGLVKQPIKYEFALPEDKLANYQSQFVQSAVRSGIANTEEGVQQMNEFAKGRIIAENFAKIQEAERVATNNAITDFLFKEYNVKLPEKQAAGAAGGATKDPNYAEQVFQHQGKNRRNS